MLIRDISSLFHMLCEKGGSEEEGLGETFQHMKLLANPKWLEAILLRADFDLQVNDPDGGHVDG